MCRLSSVATTTDGQGTLLYFYSTQDRQTIVRHKPNFNQQEMQEQVKQQNQTGHVYVRITIDTGDDVGNLLIKYRYERSQQ